MSTGIFTVLGSDVAEGVGISTNSSGGSNGLGEATISGGTQIFEADDVVVISVQNMTADGQIGNGSAVSDLTVFDSVQDYQTWLDTGDNTLVKYNYAPQNPGQTATVQSDLSGLGDGYLKFNANVLQPVDGGPWIGSTLTVAPETDIGTNGGAPVTLDHVQDIDLNYDSDTADSHETGDGLFYVGDYLGPAFAAPPVCFARGTLIATPVGERPIETIRPGDKVLTLDNGAQPVLWAGCRSVIGTGSNAPVTFEKGALCNHASLTLSPNHKLLRRSHAAELLFGTSECMVAAKFLTHQSGVNQWDTGLVHYHHLMLARHEILFANGVPCESLLPDPAKLHPLAGRDALALPSSPIAARPCLRQHEATLLTH
ncbi:Hint domain-containing protein [Phaeobacter sp. PT47_59]|uniref:Hint domain-containing protein n=1 Tax=Phaeobacter sp. PT47_59 TaxID=3029979 RepID=UPI00237FED7B|nr:Hint domain-containing protein [Phaeobacter sp. PT47_59]MDE4173235.1 Hint domain-containing protein [Phaeobacter sp. PT47_59]